MEQNLIRHEMDNTLILQRAVDGYVNATAMCKAVGKAFAGYRRMSATQAFMEELSRSMRIHMDLLVSTRTTGRNEERGTWVHPDVAINLGQWCSPRFAVAVSKWVRDWIAGKSGASQPPVPQLSRLELLEMAYEAEKKLHAQTLQLELKDAQLEEKRQRVLEQNSQLVKVKSS